MKSKIFLSLCVGLLVVFIFPLATNVSFASHQGNSSDSSSNGTNDPGVIEPGQAYVIFDQATRHINEAQSALQNGDTEG